VTTESSTLQAPPTPCLDHVMVLVDQETYAAVVAEEFLGTRFARRKHKQADSSIAGSYSTLGLAGRNTLVELFEAVPNGSPLTGGLVFSFEHKGSARRARSVLDQSGLVGYHYDLVRRAVDGVEAPWYHLINVDLGPGSPLLLFLNEVTPEYFASIGATEATDGTLRRRDYLDAALGEADGGNRMFGDITGVGVAVTPDRADRITSALIPFGFTAEHRPDGVELVRDDLTLVLRLVETEPERVTEIALALTGAPGAEPGAEFVFGKGSRLIVDSATAARWIFD
jgi:hypothetical protein